MALIDRLSSEVRISRVWPGWSHLPRDARDTLFLLAVIALQPQAIYSGGRLSLVVLVALLVCLIPTTIGALLSAAVTLPLAWPMAASAQDMGLLAFLGVVQLAIPCLMAVAAARVLSAPEISLLGLLEVVFGVAWAWLGAGEAPSTAVLGGGLLVLLALAGNEALALIKPARPRSG